MRTSIARVAAGTLVVLAACTGAPASTSPSWGRPGGSTSAPPEASRGSRTGSLSRRVPHRGRARGATVAFVADGNAWVLDPDERRRRPASSPRRIPGPFAWNPRGDRALLSGLEIRSIRGVQLRAGSSLDEPPYRRGVIRSARPSSTSPTAGRASARSIPATQRRDDITPVAHVHYLNVDLPPVGSRASPS